MSYHPDDSDPYRRRPPRRPATPPATTPATTTTPPPIPPAEQFAWLMFTDAVAEPAADLLGRAIEFAKARLTGGWWWEVAEDVLAAAAVVGKLWFDGGYTGRIDPANILRRLTAMPVFARIAHETSDVFGALVMVAARYHIDGADREAVLRAAEEVGETYLRAAGVLHLVRGDDHDDHDDDDDED